MFIFNKTSPVANSNEQVDGQNHALSKADALTKNLYKTLLQTGFFVGISKKSVSKEYEVKKIRNTKKWFEN